MMLFRNHSSSILVRMINFMINNSELLYFLVIGSKHLVSLEPSCILPLPLSTTTSKTRPSFLKHERQKIITSLRGLCCTPQPKRHICMPAHHDSISACSGSLFPPRLSAPLYRQFSYPTKAVRAFPILRNPEDRVVEITHDAEMEEVSVVKLDRYFRITQSRSGGQAEYDGKKSWLWIWPPWDLIG